MKAKLSNKMICDSGVEKIIIVIFFIVLNHVRHLRKYKFSMNLYASNGRGKGSTVINQLNVDVCNR